jgi:transglutaminase-like putative cysteine protease
MAIRYEDIMGRRLGQLAGLYALVLVLARLGRLLQSGPDLPRWHLILIAATLLGAIVWWLISQTALKMVVGVYLFALGGLIVFLRVAVPATLTAGVIPTAETLPTLAEVFETALRLIRSGVPPVYPEAGVVAILAVLMWALGGVFAGALGTGQLTLMILPAGVVYLQFAIFDRRQAGMGWMLLSGAGLVLAVTAVALRKKEHIGRARDRAGRPKAHRSVGAALAMAGLVGAVAVLTANSATGMISEYGNVPWRSGVGGSGPGTGGVAFDRFVDLRQRLQSRDNILLFRATLGPDAPPAGELYWRMESLDVFDGVSWRRGGSQIRNYEPGIRIGNQDYVYQGTTTSVLQRVFISRLFGVLVPTAGTATEIHQIDADDAIPARSFRVGRDATIYYPSGIQPDDNYQVETQFPLYDLDLGAMATGADGALTPMFAAASEAGLFGAAAAPLDHEVVQPDDLGSFTDLPNEVPVPLRGIASRITRGASTDFERAWMLQHWFRDSGEFTYSLDVSTGHGALVLADWLDDPESPNYRTGYCEQFAASMAVLGRVLGIPSRVVWGFTPGTTTDVDGIEVIEVRDTNAHAWVEMWMDGFGWVRFDPTPRGEFQPASLTDAFDPELYVPEDLPTGIGAPEAPPIVDIAPGFVDEVGTPVGGALRWRWWILVLPAAAMVLSMIPLVKRARRRSRLRRLHEGDITAAWDEIVDRLADMGEPVAMSLTPLEFARATDTALIPLAIEYSATIYGGRTGNARESDLVSVEWWIQRRFETARRLRGALNPRSLLKRQ